MGAYVGARWIGDERLRLRLGRRSGCAVQALQGVRCTTHDDAEVSRVRQRSDNAWQHVDRAAPYTVPMKAVPPECGALGRVRPAPLALKARGAYGLFGSHVPVRPVPRPGSGLRRLRPRPALLHTNLFRPGPPRGTPRRRSALPVQPRRPRGSRSTFAALAHPPAPSASCDDALRGRKYRDAPGFH